MFKMTLNHFTTAHEKKNEEKHAMVPLKTNTAGPSPNRGSSN